MESVAFGCVPATELNPGFRPASIKPLIESSAGEVTTAIDERIRRSKLVRTVQRMRRRREAFFDSTLFADPAWDMLLELHATYLEQRRIAVSSLCVASHVPATTALRWIAKLEQDGLAVRKSDPGDGRRSWIELTCKGVDCMNRYFEARPAGCFSI
jgi:hypothetical protein